MYDFGILVAFLWRYVLGCLIGTAGTLILIGVCWCLVRVIQYPYSKRRRVRERLGL